MLIEGTKIRLMKEIQGFEMLKIGDIFVIHLWEIMELYILKQIME
ncbi:hypothetical protein [Clostridioides difficile]|nr:hypothetical protein [Clostridioides difficile]EQL12303.1 hypothetical protein QE1_0316 [Clostridioides difficile CD86]